MTREEIESLSGWELDCAVAVACFGYRWWRSADSGRRCIYAEGKNPEWMRTPADMSEKLVTDFFSDHHVWHWTPLYSNPDGALELMIRKLHEWGYHYHLEDHNQEDGEDVSCLLAFCHGGQFHLVSATGHCINQAMARALLLVASRREKPHDQPA